MLNKKNLNVHSSFFKFHFWSYLLKIMFECGKNTTISVAISCPVVWISDVMEQGPKSISSV